MKPTRLALERLESRQLLAATRLTDIAPAEQDTFGPNFSGGGSAAAMTAFRGEVLFIVDGAVNDTIYISTSSGSRELHTGPRLSLPVVNDDGAFFLSGTELWFTDGVDTRMVRAFDDFPAYPAPFSADIVATDSQVFFVADDGDNNGFEVWVSDGTPAGTQMAYDPNRIYAGITSPSPDHLTAIGNFVYFEADSPGLDNEIWRTDGTTTDPITSFTAPGAFITTIEAAGDVLYFFGSFLGGIGAFDTRSGELIETPGASSTSTVVGEDLFWVTPGLFQPNGLWRFDSSARTTARVADLPESRVLCSLFNVNDTAFYVCDVDDVWEIWSFEDTGPKKEGGFEVRDGLSVFDQLAQLTAYQDQVLFVLEDQSPIPTIGWDDHVGTEIFSLDTTTGNTIVLCDVYPGHDPALDAHSSWPYGLTVAGDSLFFIADDGEHGFELWRYNVPASDLAITSAVVNADNLTQGEIFTMDVRVFNRGDAVAPSYGIDVFLSDDPVLDSSDISIGQPLNVLSTLTPGASETSRVSAQIPPVTAAGTYHILTRIDVPGEDDPSNNVSGDILTIGTIGGELDLAAIGLSLAQTSLPPGGSTTADWQISNNGTSDAGELDTRLFLSSDQLFDATDVAISNSVSVRSLPAGQTEQIANVSLTIPPSTNDGSYFVLAVADPDVLLADTSRNNNVVSQGVEVQTENDRPDLLVTLTAEPTPSVVAPEQEFSFQWAITNQGNAATSGAIQVRTYLSADENFSPDDVILDTTASLPLAPGEADTRPAVSHVIPSGTATGNYFVIVFADFDDRFVESNEANNTLAVPVSVQTNNNRPDLVVTLTAGPTTSVVAPAQEFSFQWTITNQGNAATSGAIPVRTYFSVDDTVSPDDIILDTTANLPLAAGEAETRPAVSHVIPLETAVGDYYVIVFADFDDRAIESNEDNNTLAFPLTVRDSNVWQNLDDPLDVNDDGITNPNDINVIITELTLRRFSDDSGKLIEHAAPRPFYDVNNDTFVAPNDIIPIVNFLITLGQNAGAPIVAPSTANLVRWHDSENVQHRDSSGNAKHPLDTASDQARLRFWNLDANPTTIDEFEIARRWHYQRDHDSVIELDAAFADLF